MAEKSQCGANTYPAGTDWHGNSHTTHEMNQRCYLVTWDTSSNSADVFLSVRWYPFFSGLVRAHVTPPRFGPKFWQLVFEYQHGFPVCGRLHGWQFRAWLCEKCSLHQPSRPRDAALLQRDADLLNVFSYGKRTTYCGECQQEQQGAASSP